MRALLPKVTFGMKLSNLTPHPAGRTHGARTVHDKESAAEQMANASYVALSHVLPCCGACECAPVIDALLPCLLTSSLRPLGSAAQQADATSITE